MLIVAEPSIENTPSVGGVFSMVNLIESNWNDILMEFNRLYHLMRGLSLA